MVGADCTTCVPVNVGTTLSSNNGVRFQVHLAVYDVDSTYEMRWYQVVPTALLNDSYIAPVGTDDDGGNHCSAVVFYNQNIGTILGVEDGGLGLC